MQYIGSLVAAENTLLQKLAKRKSAHFCSDFANMYYSSRLSATIFAKPCGKKSSRSAQIRKDQKPFRDPFLQRRNRESLETSSFS